MTQHDKIVNNLKWQRRGVLNLLNKPEKDVRENYEWNEEVKEIQKIVDENKIKDELGKRMGDTKLD